MAERKSTKGQKTIYKCRTCRTHYPDSESTSICSFSLMLRAYRRSKIFFFYSLWFDPTWARIHDLPHSGRER
jgi:hypothetical protein